MNSNMRIKTVDDYIEMPDGRPQLRQNALNNILGPELATNEGCQDYARLTDTSNAELLANLFGQKLRYDHKKRRWLLWKGHRWEPDQDGHISRLAMDAARVRYASAELVNDLRERKRIADWAIGSESRMRLDACISIARNIRPIADNGEGWDMETMLLGVSNGVLDLTTGKIKNGCQDDGITMTTGVDFDPSARCPRWEQFLVEVFGEDGLIDWIQRSLGYSITGNTSEQCVFIGHGSGANGKTKFYEAIKNTLGNYSYSAPFPTFELHQRAGIPNDLAALEFKRFVTSSETNDNTRLNESRIKAISGGDPITARYLHAEYFTFNAHLKLWLFVNHKPKVADDSHGFWRRVRLIPFTRQFSGENDDKELGEKLRAEAPGILAWLVRGCLEWQKRRLEPLPECVKTATETYKAESDDLIDFVNERCIDSVGCKTKASDLYRAYVNWAISQGFRDKEILTANAFGRRMADKYRREKSREGTYYQGITLSITEP
jgi:putative DNA primase/helicase